MSAKLQWPASFRIRVKNEWVERNFIVWSWRPGRKCSANSDPPRRQFGEQQYVYLVAVWRSDTFSPAALLPEREEIFLSFAKLVLLHFGFEFVEYFYFLFFFNCGGTFAGIVSLSEHLARTILVVIVSLMSLIKLSEWTLMVLAVSRQYQNVSSCATTAGAFVCSCPQKIKIIIAIKRYL